MSKRRSTRFKVVRCNTCGGKFQGEQPHWAHVNSPNCNGPYTPVRP